MSVSQQTCEVELMLGGYAYTVSEDEAKPREQRDNVTLEMHLLDDGGYPIEPIVIEAGGVRLIRAVYRTPLSEEPLPAGGTLYDLLNAALQGAERNWRLTVHAVLQRNAATAIESRKLSFRDIHATQADARFGQAALRRETTDGLRRLLKARDTELSEVRAELSTTRTSLAGAEERVGELIAALREQQSSAAESGRVAVQSETVTEVHGDGATSPPESGV